MIHAWENLEFAFFLLATYPNLLALHIGLCVPMNGQVNVFYPCLWSRGLPPSRKGQLRILWLNRLRKNNVFEVVHGFSLGCGASDNQKKSRLFKFATSAHNYFTISYSI